MWILLQFISMAKSKSNLQSPQVNNAKSMFDGKNRDLGKFLGFFFIF